MLWNLSTGITQAASARFRLRPDFPHRIALLVQELDARLALGRDRQAQPIPAVCMGAFPISRNSV